MVSRGVTSSKSNYNLFLSQQTARLLHVRRRDVSPRPTVDSPLQRLYYTFCVRKQGKGKQGDLVSARARPTFPENSKTTIQAVAVAVAVPAVLRSGGRGRGGRRLGSRCRGSGEGEKDQILSGTEFALCWTSSENGLKTCTPVVRSSSVVMAQNAELVSLLVDGCRYGDMEDVTEGENRRNRDPSHGRKGVCALQSDSGSDRSEN